MLVVPSTIGAPETITILFRAPAFALDLTTVTSASLSVRRRDGTTATWALTILSQTPSEMLAQYAFVGGEITGTGAYYLAPVVNVIGGSFHGRTITMFVTTPFDCAPRLEDECWIATTSGLPAVPPWAQPAAYQATLIGAQPAPGPLFSLQRGQYQRVNFNSKNGPLQIATSAQSPLGDTLLVYDVGGFAQTNPAILTDPRAYPIQDPQGQGLVLVASYHLQIPGGSWAWTLSQDSLSQTIFWAVTG